MTNTNASVAQTFSCRHCGNRHPALDGDTTIMCRCGADRPHVACPDTTFTTDDDEQPALMLIRMISAVQDGELADTPAVAAKIAELTERATVPVVYC